MLRKSLFAAALVLQPAPTASQGEVEQNPIPLVSCDLGAGTAFRIGPKLLLSVNHVTNLKGCMIDGQPIHIAYRSRRADFSELSDDRAGKWLKVDCRGFVPGRTYIIVGHARGLNSLIGIEAIATGAYSEGQAVLVGTLTAQPGQSGGPIVDAETHEVVGTVNAADWENGTTFSVELKQTPICGSDLA